MYNLKVSFEQEQHELPVNASLHKQNLQDDSLFAASHDPVCQCVPQQWDIKPDLDLLNQDIKPDLDSLSQHDQQYQSDTTIGSQHHGQQDDISIVSTKECNGL